MKQNVPIDMPIYQARHFGMHFASRGWKEIDVRVWLVQHGYPRGGLTERRMLHAFDATLEKATAGATS